MNESTLIDRIRWRLCWWLMPSIALAREKRRLEDLARELGASKTLATGVASRYFASLKEQK